MIKYQHTQIGSLMIAVLIFVVLLYAFILIKAGNEPVALAVMVAVLLVLASFMTLRVVIDEQYLRIKFGYGIFRKKFLLQDIVSVRSVKNRWYYGWGIRYWIGAGPMWIFNVSGFDAVEIVKKNGRIYRIGTDEPRELEAAIKQGIKK